MTRSPLGPDTSVEDTRRAITRGFKKPDTELPYLKQEESERNSFKKRKGGFFRRLFSRSSDWWEECCTLRMGYVNPPWNVYRDVNPLCMATELVWRKKQLNTNACTPGISKCTIDQCVRNTWKITRVDDRNMCQIESPGLQHCSLTLHSVHLAWFTIVHWLQTLIASMVFVIDCT